MPACCEWDTFQESLLGSWRRARHNPSPLLIDWRQARLHWKRYGCTGGESATMQLQQLASEADALRTGNAKMAGPHGPCPMAAKFLAKELLDRLAARKI